jgi:hypothetical protein
VPDGVGPELGTGHRIDDRNPAVEAADEQLAEPGHSSNRVQVVAEGREPPQLRAGGGIEHVHAAIVITAADEQLTTSSENVGLYVPVAPTAVSTRVDREGYRATRACQALTSE